MPLFWNQWTYMKKAVLYARVSSDLQKKERTIESQITELKSQIKESQQRLVALHTPAAGLGAFRALGATRR